MTTGSKKLNRRCQTWRLDWFGRLLVFLMLVVFIGGVCFAEQHASRRLKRQLGQDSIALRPLSPEPRR